jgi:hypothetical protein
MFGYLIFSCYESSGEEDLSGTEPKGNAGDCPREIGKKQGQPESLSEKMIPEPGINNLQTPRSLQVVDSSFQKIYLRQAPRLSPS